MRYIAVFIAVLFTVLLLMRNFNDKTSIILIKKSGFEPNSIEIRKGQKIEFKNEDSSPHWPASDIHPTHGTYPEFDPLMQIEPGKDWRFTFKKPGKWKYHDHLNPNIEGRIIVNP